MRVNSWIISCRIIIAILVPVLFIASLDSVITCMRVYGSFALGCPCVLFRSEGVRIWSSSARWLGP